LGIAGICGDLWLISSSVPRLWVICLVCLAFVASCGELSTVSAFDADFFGISIGFLGMQSGRLVQKRTVEDGKMCG
jgi:hypothetical protein